jgi:hypothetical protein
MLPRKSVVLTVLLGLFDTQGSCFDNFRYSVKSYVNKYVDKCKISIYAYVFKTGLGSSKQTLSCFNGRKNRQD